jgi:hypothetical protein
MRAQNTYFATTLHFVFISLPFLQLSCNLIFSCVKRNVSESESFGRGFGAAQAHATGKVQKRKEIPPSKGEHVRFSSMSTQPWAAVCRKRWSMSQNCFPMIKQERKHAERDYQINKEKRSLALVLCAMAGGAVQCRH